MSNDPVFSTALAYVLLHEGSSYVDDPTDPGGATKFGISLRALQALGHLDGLDLDFNDDGHVDARDIAAMTQAEASQIYREAYWDKWGYGRINDPTVTTKVFDLAVNMGPAQAHRLAQRAIRCVWFPVPEDGVLGTQTVSALNAARPDILYASLKSEAAGFYRWLATAKPTVSKYLDGWLTRAYSNPGATQ